MEQMKDNGIGGAKVKKMVPPPLPQPLPRFWVRKTVPESVTKQEIAKFWRKKRIEEEDHLLAAIKTAARIRARNLSVRFFYDASLDIPYLQSEWHITTINST